MKRKKFNLFVDDVVIQSEVKKIIDTYRNALNKVDSEFYDNKIDPFSAYLEASSLNVNFESWKNLERHRQVQKSMQNEIGYFHQHILGAIDGWRDPGQGGGWDSENSKKKIIAEIKNKYNTLNARSAVATYDKMVSYLNNQKKGYKGYIVIIVPRNSKPYERPFSPSSRKIRDDLYEIDGASYYDLCTGEERSLQKLYEALPKVVESLNLKINPQESDLVKFMELFGKIYDSKDQI